MLSTSIYAITEAEPPKWTFGEEQAASAFVGMTLWLAVDVIFCVNRVFKKKKGLYFWSIFLGMVFIMVDVIGIILKYLTPNTEHIWPVYTLFLLSAWAVYPVCQLLVLYSRLHLVSDIPWIRKVILGLIISVEFIAVLPIWVCNWHSYNPDPKITSLWSPRAAIVERYNQLVVSLVEVVISGTYIYSLINILGGRVGVKQKRVMRDLIYVNVLVIGFDIITIVLVYFNRTGISHPVQSFSYALKLKLEFLVLNQLMIVAARGVRKKCWEEKRYLDKGEDSQEFSARARRLASSTSPANKRTMQKDQLDPLEESYIDTNPNLAIAPPATDYPPDHNNGQAPPTPKIDPSDPDLEHPQATHGAIRAGLTDDETTSSSAPPQPSHHSSDTTVPLKDQSSSPRNTNRIFSLFERHKPRNRKMNHLSPRSHLDFNPNTPQNATLRVRSHHADDDDEDEDEIPLHMWERRGTVLLYAPWMKQPAKIEKKPEGEEV